MSQSHRNEIVSKAPSTPATDISRKKRRPFCKNGQYSVTKTMRNIVHFLNSYYAAKGVPKELRHPLTSTSAKVVSGMCITLAELITEECSKLAERTGRCTINKDDVISAFKLNYSGKMRSKVKLVIEDKLAGKHKL